MTPNNNLTPQAIRVAALIVTRHKGERRRKKPAQPPNNAHPQAGLFREQH